MGISSLDSALAGLRVSQQQINVISNNVANIGTPGYSRKILPQSSQAIQGTTVGVRGETIIRNVDLNLERDLWTQISASGELSVQETYLNRIIQFHGPPDQELSIAAEIARLRDNFSALSDSPEDSFLQSQALDGAQDTVQKFNDLSNLITTLRNDAQDEISTTIERINDLLAQIADLNEQVKDNLNIGRTTAFTEDKRDDAIKELAGLMDVSFFQRGDGVLVIQTNRGVELASDRAEIVSFNSNRLGAISVYPDSINGIIVGDPDIARAVDITTQTPGGKLGGLLELRDTIFPKQMAQLDEAAHKLAQRFDAQGLRLFTNRAGIVPLDTPPDTTTDPVTPVSYVGFSVDIQVNQNILSDTSLLKNGTYGANLNTGSNEIISRVLQFAFGSINFQQAENTNTATQIDLLNTGGADLQDWLGLPSSNTLTGGRDLTPFASVADLISSANGTLDDPNDQFQITFEETRSGLGPTTITLDLSVADGFAGANATEQLVNHINDEITAAAVPAGLAAQASVGANGELVISTRGSYEVDSNFGANGLTGEGLIFLGLSDNAGAPIAPTDPYFDVQIGNQDAVRIIIEPGDTSTELLAKLEAVDGLAIDTTNFALDGILRMRPGDDFDFPNYGGSMRITGGPFDTNGSTYGTPPATTTRTAIDNGVNIASALFGTYSVSGAAILEESPVTNIAYGSQTNASALPPIPELGFRENFLGPNANITTFINGASSIIDFADKMVNEHAQSYNLISASREDEEALQEVLQTQFLNESAVNIDQELGHLIIVQTAYSASARVLTAVDELFQELLNAVR